MSATDLVLHHRYRSDIAYDWSRHRNHGTLVSVATGPSPNPLAFAGGEDRVEVAPSSSLRDFGELRIRVVFRPYYTHLQPTRYNLVEGEYAFALFINDDASLMGTVNSPSAGWIGPRSAPRTVDFTGWNTADFLHDGIGHARLYLGGVLVAERWDAAGPLRRTLGDRGVWIGHWPGDGRYTFRGQIAEVQIWKDDPRDDAERVLDDCCVDEGWIDERVAEARRAGWGPETTRDRLGALRDGMAAAAAEVRGGNATRTAQLQQLTQRALNALAGGDPAGLDQQIDALRSLVWGRLGAHRAHELGGELYGLLRDTPVGLWIGDDPDRLVAFLREVAERTCLDGSLPPWPDDGRPERPDVDPDRADDDPHTDHDPPGDPKPSGEKEEERPPDARPPTVRPPKPRPKRPPRSEP